MPGNGNSNSGVSRVSFGGEDSNGANDYGDGGSDAGEDSVPTARSIVGIGKGKPFAAALAQQAAASGKRKRFGFVGRPRGGGVGGGNGIPMVTNWKGQAANKPGDGGSTPVTSGSSSGTPSTALASIATKKRLSEVRRRGRQPKIRGMVGLQVRSNSGYCQYLVRCLIQFCLLYANLFKVHCKFLSDF